MIGGDEARYFVMRNREIKCWETAHYNDNVIRFYGHVEIEGNDCFISDYLPGGNL